MSLEERKNSYWPAIAMMDKHMLIVQQIRAKTPTPYYKCYCKPNHTITALEEPQTSQTELKSGFDGIQAISEKHT